MKISTKGRYGLRAMVDLAVHAGSEHVPLSSIAERQNVSENYMEQVFSTLRKAGLVRSIKGAQGGYILADVPSKTTVGDVLRVLEGRLEIVDTEEEVSPNSVEYLLKTNVWALIDKSINNVIDTITLEDLAEEYKERNGKLEIMYYI